MVVALPLSARRTEHGSWCFFSRDYADEGITFSQTVLHCATCDAWQCRGEPLGWRLARVDGWHGPAPRAEQAHREWPVTSRTGEGALHGFRWIMAWCTVCLPSAWIAKRCCLSRTVDRATEHSDASDAGATARWKCGRPDQLAALRARTPRRSGPVAACSPAGSTRHAVADDHWAEYPRQLRTIRADHPSHAHRHIFLR